MRKKSPCLRIKNANPFLLNIMKRYNCYGILMPWRTIYLSQSDDPKILKHELVHFAQIQREGKFILGDIKFWFKYAYYNLKVGYRRNPYEIEADRIAGTAGYKNG